MQHSNYVGQLKDHLNSLNISALKRKAVVATVQGQWKDRWFSSFNHWRVSGDNEHYQYMQYCDQIVKELEVIA